jgi:hypothetical protein
MVFATVSFYWRTNPVELPPPWRELGMLNLTCLDAIKIKFLLLGGDLSSSKRRVLLRQRNKNEVIAHTVPQDCPIVTPD